SAAKAVLERAEATAANAAQDVERYRGLVAEQAISQQEYDAAMARLRTAEADVSQARAQVDSAQLNLDYTTVSTPIAGRAGRAEVSEGALVSAANATLLTTVEQHDPVYVNFSQSSSELLSFRYQFAAGALALPEGIRMTVRLTLEDGSEYPQSGHLDFFAMTIDPSTGTVALRAEFPNPDRLLLPGQFVNARVEAGLRPEGLMIPQRAVTLTEQQALVMVVDADDIAALRTVELGNLRDGNWIIREGLSPGERVIIDGTQKVRPGQPVRPTTAPAGQLDSPGPAREES
ncbi:MAG: efflux RND transporter periplasmic adaptor subunit, partial [Bacteroidales bacterium]|nr:efflux RND transporter periplasmic adaptor subunit [Bacteroidales bacterium]